MLSRVEGLIQVTPLSVDLHQLGTRQSTGESPTWRRSPWTDACRFRPGGIEHGAGVGGAAEGQGADAASARRDDRPAGSASRLTDSAPGLFDGIDALKLGYQCAEHITTPSATHVVQREQTHTTG